MSVEMFSTYTGPFVCESKHGPSGHVVLSESPADDAEPKFFGPTDLFALSLSTCILTTMGLVAGRRGIDMRGATARTEKHMATQPVRRIGRIVVDIHLPAKLTDDERKLLERTAHTCPVHRSLHPDIQIEMTFQYV